MWKKYYSHKNIVITGAASGIGKGIALKLASLGANLVISDINLQRLDQTKKELEPSGVKVIALKCDVSNQTDIKNLVKTALNEFKFIHIIFSNAGIYMGGPFEFLSIDQWQKIMNVNLWGMIYSIKAFIPKLLEQKTGHIVITSSIAGSLGAGGVIPYSTSKFANSGFGEALYGEYKSKGVHVSILCPFPLRTNLIDTVEFGFPPNILEKVNPLAAQKGIQAAKEFYWREFTKKKSGLLGGSELTHAVEKMLKKVSKKKLYIFDRRYGRFFQVIRGLWPGLYKFLLRLSCTRHVKLFDQTYQEFLKTAQQIEN